MKIYEVGSRGSFVYRMHNALQQEDCQTLIDIYRDNEDLQYVGYTGAGYNLDMKVARNLDIDKRVPDGSKIDRVLFGSLNQALNKLAKTTIGRYLKIDNDHGYMIQVYDEGGFYDWHHDFSSGKNRQLTAIWYLNDIPKEDGGATQFISQGISIQPEAGTLVIFPAGFTHVHRSSPLKRGTKHIVTTWMG